MNASHRIAWSLLFTLTLVFVAQAAELPSAAPEDLGFSAERLARIAPVIKGEIEKGQYPGAVMLIARKGKIIYFDAIGQRDPANGKPMPKEIGRAHV